MESWVGTRRSLRAPPSVPRRRSLRAPPNDILQLLTTAPWCVELPSSTQNARARPLGREPGGGAG
eukprot:5883099-Amphidinium_carterae.1